MGNIKNNYFDWNKAGSCQVRQYDHLSNRVIFGNAPKFENYYLLVTMKESESDEQAKAMSPVQLTSPVWLIPNSYTQITQQIKFQICNQAADGSFEQHSAEYTIDVLKSHDHEGEDIDVDPSPMYDAYKEYVDDRIEELIDEAGGISVDTREYVDEKIQTMIAAAGDVVIDTTLSVSGAAADAKATGDAISETNERLDNFPTIKDSDAEDVDLDVSDVDGNVIVRFADGHIKTKNFDSSQIDTNADTEVMSQITDGNADLYIADERGNGLVRFADGHIQTAEFTSDNGVYKKVFEYTDTAGTATINHFFPKGTRLAFHLVRADVAGWGHIANYNVTYKYTTKNGTVRTLGADYGYNFPAYTLPEDADFVSVTYGTGLTYRETTDLAFCVYPEASFKKQPKIITVSPDGSKDFATIRRAVDSIPVDVCELNPYEIHVYPGTYNVLADYSAEEIGTEGFKGLFLNNGTSLIGIGQRDEIILTASMDTTIYDNTKRNDVSTLNIYGNVHVENVVIKGENIRYAVHDEGSMMTHKFNIHSFKNVKFVGENLTSGGGGINAYGAGCSSNKQIWLIDCDFQDQLGIHSQYDLQHEVTFYLENCTARRFAFTDYENTNANAHVVLRNCKADIITINQTTDGQTQSMTFDGIGECNALIKCPTGYVYNFGCCNEYVGAQIGAGYAVKLNNVLNGITVATNRIQINGISVGTRDGNTVMQRTGYINSNILGLTGLAVGDYLTIDNTGKVVSGGTADNAVAVVKVVDSSGVAYAKLMI